MNKRAIKNFNSRKSFSSVETFDPLNEDLAAHSPAVIYFKHYNEELFCLFLVIAACVGAHINTFGRCTCPMALRLYSCRF